MVRRCVFCFCWEAVTTVLLLVLGGLTTWFDDIWLAGFWRDLESTRFTPVGVGIFGKDTVSPFIRGFGGQLLYFFSFPFRTSLISVNLTMNQGSNYMKYEIQTVLTYSKHNMNMRHTSKKLNCTILLITSLTVYSYVSQPTINQQAAKSLLKLRTKRANAGVFEESASANFERECLEQKCSENELNEVFKQDESVKSSDVWEIKDFRMALRDPCTLQTQKPCTSLDCSSSIIQRCFGTGTMSCRNVERTPYFECNCRKGYVGDFCENCRHEFYCEHGEAKSLEISGYCVTNFRGNRHSCLKCDRGYRLNVTTCEMDKAGLRIAILENTTVLSVVEASVAPESTKKVNFIARSITSFFKNMFRNMFKNKKDK